MGSRLWSFTFSLRVWGFRGLYLLEKRIFEASRSSLPGALYQDPPLKGPLIESPWPGVYLRVVGGVSVNGDLYWLAYSLQTFRGFWGYYGFACRVVLGVHTYNS